MEILPGQGLASFNRRLKSLLTNLAKRWAFLAPAWPKLTTTNRYFGARTTNPPTTRLCIHCRNQEPTSLFFGCGFKEGASNCRLQARMEHPSSYKRQPTSRIGLRLPRIKSTAAFSRWSNILLRWRQDFTALFLNECLWALDHYFHTGKPPFRP